MGQKDNKIKILVCYYQPEKLPKEDIYFPIQAGKAISKFKLNVQGDDIGDNISAKNETFSELTAWYWGWKNIKTIYPNIEYIGLSHYRRFFALNEPFEEYTKIYKNKIPKMYNYENLIIKKLKKKDIIMVKPASFGCDLKTQYERWHNIKDYFCLKNIIHEIYPEYDKTFTNFFEENKKISLYCMFISKFELFDRYFEWVFPILFEMEKRIDTSEYDPYQKRVIAFLAERLINIYVIHNRLRVDYEPIYYIDGERLIDYNIKNIFRKIIKFIMPYGFVRRYQDR